VSCPLTAMGIPHLVWCASTMEEDRADRRRSMPAARRLFDRLVVGPVQRRMEKTILAGPARFMTVSEHSRRTLVAAGGEVDRFFALPVPVDETGFTPPAAAARPGVIGFAGRPNDPRKNLPLLFDAAGRLLQTGCEIELRLTGTPDAALERAAEQAGVAGKLRWLGWLPDDEMPRFFQSLDIFVIPSFQEGLNIAGVQALACGVPVVSTRCGGPVDYVIDGSTGFLTGFNSVELAERMRRIIEHRDLRRELGANGRRKVERDYALSAFGARLRAPWQATWQEWPHP